VIGSGKSKIGQLDSHTLVGDEDILWLQIPVVDSNRMAVLHGIQDLEKGPLGKGIVPNILASLRDVGKEITLGAVLNDNVSAVRRVHDLDQGNHIGMGTGLVMQLDLALLELALAGLQA